MSINIHNYEAFFLDYYEGNLTPQQVADLLLFVEQHPEVKEEFEGFENVVLDDLEKIVFEGKEKLKNISIAADHLLIAAAEGLLTNQETILLNHQLSVNAEMKHSLSLYKQTKLVADASIVYENKEELKRKERKVIPLFYYIAAAAAVLLLFGLFFLFSTNNNEPKFAKNSVAPSVNQQQTKQTQEIKIEQPVMTTAYNTSKEVIKTIKEIHKHNKVENVQENQVAVENKQPEIINQEQIPNNKQFPSNNEQPVVAQVEKQNSTTNLPAVASAKEGNQFLRLGEIAAEKIKENTLTPEALAYQKKTGRLKKFNGWDLLGVVAKGVSKITGKKVEVEHTAADDGAVTAMR